MKSMTHGESGPYVLLSDGRSVDNFELLARDVMQSLISIERMTNISSQFYSTFNLNH